METVKKYAGQVALIVVTIMAYNYIAPKIMKPKAPAVKA